MRKLLIPSVDDEADGVELSASISDVSKFHAPKPSLIPPRRWTAITRITSKPSKIDPAASKRRALDYFLAQAGCAAMHIPASPLAIRTWQP